MKHLLSALLFCLFALPIFAQASPSPLRVVTSTSHIADIVKNVGGERVALTSLMGPGVDPHLYKATARDVISLQRADLTLYNGLFLEGRLADTFSKVSRKGRSTIAVAEGIPEERLLSPTGYQTTYDPHVWFDPDLWSFAVDAVVDALVTADPDHASEYEENGAAYKKQIAELRSWAEGWIAEVPEERRVLVTSHDAYSYFGRAFGVDVVGVQGISTATEAGLADIAKMVDMIRERRIPAIFVESSVSPSTIQRISRDSGAVVGGELFSDALGRAGDLREGFDGELYDVGTYIGMFKYNVHTIVTALR